MILPSPWGFLLNGVRGWGKFSIVSLTARRAFRPPREQRVAAAEAEWINRPARGADA
jgi:hypothetical protein